MPRTPEQVAADEQLTRAIEAVQSVYGMTEEAWVMSEYVVVAAGHRYDDEGESVTAISTLYRDGDVPVHRALGLLTYASTQLRTYIAGGRDDE